MKKAQLGIGIAVLFVVNFLGSNALAFGGGSSSNNSPSSSAIPAPTTTVTTLPVPLPSISLPPIPQVLSTLLSLPPFKLKDPSNTGTTQPQTLGSQSSGGYSPSQIKSVYSISSSLGTGAGQTIGIVVAYGSSTLANDLATFDSQYGLSAPNLQTYTLSGTSVGSNDDWAVETTLDVEWAHAIAPGASILLVICPSNNNSDLLQGVQYAAAHANIVSMSWGTAESQMSAEEQSLTNYFAASNVTFVAATGDNGFGTEWPSTDPHVIAVGGTSLQLDLLGNRSSETAWSGTGGGVSSFSSSAAQTAWSNDSMREVPDVSYNADPNYGYNVYLTSGGYNGWIVVGGTSAGTPQWAAIMALVNANRSSNLGQPLSTIYNDAKTNAYFFDITSGCDNSSNTDCAKSGYDDVTGMGVPVVSTLVSALSPSTVSSSGSTSGSSSGSSSSSSSSSSASGSSSGSSSSGGGCGQSRSPASVPASHAWNLGIPFLVAALIQLWRKLWVRK
jgi:subtilase family serine protease